MGTLSDNIEHVVHCVGGWYEYYKGWESKQEQNRARVKLGDFEGGCLSP